MPARVERDFNGIGERYAADNVNVAAMVFLPPYGARDQRRKQPHFAERMSLVQGAVREVDEETAEREIGDREPGWFPGCASDRALAPDSVSSGT